MTDAPGRIVRIGTRTANGVGPPRPAGVWPVRICRDVFGKSVPVIPTLQAGAARRLLTGRKLVAVQILGKWCPGAESNHRHCDFQSHALPTELPGPLSCRVGDPCLPHRPPPIKPRPPLDRGCFRRPVTPHPATPEGPHPIPGVGQESGIVRRASGPDRRPRTEASRRGGSPLMVRGHKSDNGVQP